MSFQHLDLISFSPSLLAILHHLHYKDILNCQLVNRRLTHIIQSNKHRLPRNERSFFIETKMDENGHDVHYVQVHWNHFHVHPIYLTNHRLRLQYPKSSPILSTVLRYYRENGIRCGDTSSFPDEPILKNLQGSLYGEFITEDFRINSIEEALREFLNFFVKNCNIYMDIDWFVLFEAEDRTPENLVTIVKEVMKEHRCRCKHLSVFNIFSNPFEEFLDAIGCEQVFVKVEQESLMSFLGKLTNWRRTIIVTMENPVSLSEVVELLQMWETNGFHIRNFIISIEEKEFDWSHREMISAVEGRFNSFSNGNMEGSRFQYVRFFLRRPRDDATICLLYSREEICIYDVDYRGLLNTIPEQYSRFI